jgi:hypothetical protein
VRCLLRRHLPPGSVSRTSAVPGPSFLPPLPRVGQRAFGAAAGVARWRTARSTVQDWSRPFPGRRREGSREPPLPACRKTGQTSSSVCPRFKPPRFLSQSTVVDIHPPCSGKSNTGSGILGTLAPHLDCRGQRRVTSVCGFRLKPPIVPIRYRPPFRFEMGRAISEHVAEGSGVEVSYRPGNFCRPARSATPISN